MDAVGQGYAEPGVVLMIAGALELDGLIVQQEAFGSAIANGAKAKDCLLVVDRSIVADHQSTQPVERRLLERPEERATHVHGLPHDGLAPGGDQSDRLGLADHAPIWRLKGGKDRGLCHRGAAVVKRGLYRHAPRPEPRILAPGVDPHAIGIHAQRVREDEPDVAVDPGTLIPPALIAGGIHPHGYHVFLLAIEQTIGDIRPKGRIAAGVASHRAAIHPHLCLCGDAIEQEHGAVGCLLTIQAKGAPIPAHAPRLAVVRVGQRWIKGLRHHPIVRQPHALPILVAIQPARRPAATLGLAAHVDAVFGHIGGQRDIPLVKPPAPIHQQMLTMPKSHVQVLSDACPGRSISAPRWGVHRASMRALLTRLAAGSRIGPASGVQGSD